MEEGSAQLGALASFALLAAAEGVLFLALVLTNRRSYFSLNGLLAAFRPERQLLP